MLLTKLAPWRRGIRVRGRRSVSAFRPRLETLESRVVPASPVIMLNDLGNQGVTLRGFEDNAFAGSSVASAGDMNGDGFDDVIVGAPQTDAGGVDRGEVYVVFGGPNLGGATLNFNDLGT